MQVEGFSVAGLPWVIRRAKGLEDEYDCSGLTFPTSRFVLIDADLDAPEFRSVLVHELVHAVETVCAKPIDEDLMEPFCTMLAHALERFLCASPESIPVVDVRDVDLED